jgi:hypothetical protein
VTRALLAVLCVLALVLVRVASAAADPTSLLRGLDTDDPTALSANITAIERAPLEPGLADVLFAAGRASEDRLNDPARALAIYERIVRELPDAGVSIAAERRAKMLLGARDHAREAGDLARLRAEADRMPATEVETRALALSAAEWPGAPDAALFLADWLCRTQRYREADQRYADFIAHTYSVPHMAVARRNQAGCAIDARNWARAEALARALPTADPVDAAVRTDLLAAAHTGRRREQLYVAAWFVAALALLLLLASLAEAILRGGARRPGWQPPVEVLYIGPIAAIVIAASFAIDRVIAPAVVRITVTGLVCAWLSGAALDLLRARGRAVRGRALLHIVACAAGVLAVGYIAIMSDGLIEMFSETVRFGPGG